MRAGTNSTSHLSDGRRRSAILACKHSVQVDAGGKGAVRVMIVVQPHAYLLEIVYALSSPRSFSGCLNGG